jgi:hypothetical protein
MAISATFGSKSLGDKMSEGPISLPVVRTGETIQVPRVKGSLCRGYGGGVRTITFTMRVVRSTSKACLDYVDHLATLDNDQAALVITTPSGSKTWTYAILNSYTPSIPTVEGTDKAVMMISYVFTCTECDRGTF